MPALNWSALRESNSRHLVKSQVHSHYAKGERIGLPGEIRTPDLLGRNQLLFIQLSYRQMFGGEARI